MSTSQIMVLISLYVQNIAHKNEALHGYVSPRVGPRELYLLEIALKYILTVPNNCEVAMKMFMFPNLFFKY